MQIEGKVALAAVEEYTEKSEYESIERNSQRNRELRSLFVRHDNHDKCEEFDGLFTICLQ